MIRIRLCGNGGQGIKFAGSIIGEVAAQKGWGASQVTIYRPSTRGAPIFSDIVLNDKRKTVKNPFFDVPDILLALSNEAFYEQLANIGKNTLVIADADTVSLPPQLPTKDVLRIPIVKNAPTPVSVNMVAIGVLSQFLGLEQSSLKEIIQKMNFYRFIKSEKQLIELNTEAFRQVITKVSKGKFIETNVNAFNIGCHLVPE